MSQITPPFNNDIVAQVYERFASHFPKARRLELALICQAMHDITLGVIESQKALQAGALAAENERLREEIKEMEKRLGNPYISGAVYTVPCSTCGGSGNVTVPGFAGGTSTNNQNCRTCGGTGWINEWKKPSYGHGTTSE